MIIRTHNFGFMAVRYNDYADENEWSLRIGIAFRQKEKWEYGSPYKWNFKFEWPPIATCFLWMRTFLYVERGKTVYQDRICGLTGRWPISIRCWYEK